MELYGTLGPACGKADLLEQMLEAGMTGMRLNLSHATLRESLPLLEQLHLAARRRGVRPELLIDLQGPELRTGTEGLPLPLREGELLPLKRLALPEILEAALEPEMELLLDDGKLCVQVLPEGRGRVLRGGILKPRKSVAVSGLSLALPVLTAEDRAHLAQAEAYGVTGVMQSFVRSREDVETVKAALRGTGLRLFAKLENQEGLRTLPEWIHLPDMLVIARGDLGNAVPLWELPAVQKRVSGLARKAGKPFLVVTQLLASMEQAAVPTRAEVSDIFNAVADGAAALMLTGETAAGRYPVEAMKMLCRTARSAEQFLREREETEDGLY